LARILGSEPGQVNDTTQHGHNTTLQNVTGEGKAQCRGWSLFPGHIRYPVNATIGKENEKKMDQLASECIEYF
jgi:hypothetical protein